MSSLRFILNDEDVEITDIKATETLLDYLRLTKRLRGQQRGLRRGRLRGVYRARRTDERAGTRL